MNNRELLQAAAKRVLNECELNADEEPDRFREDLILLASHALQPEARFRMVGTLYRTRDGIIHATTQPGFGMEVHSAMEIYVRDGEELPQKESGAE